MTDQANVAATLTLSHQKTIKAVKTHLHQEIRWTHTDLLRRPVADMGTGIEDTYRRIIWSHLLAGETFTETRTP